MMASTLLEAGKQEGIYARACVAEIYPRPNRHYIQIHDLFTVTNDSSQRLVYSEELYQVMSHKGPPGFHQSNGKAPPSAPTTSTSKEKKKAKGHDAVNSAIKATKVAKGATETVPLLSPLKVTMGSLISLLETIKVENLQ
jgi:hypothetical protein